MEKSNGRGIPSRAASRVFKISVVSVSGSSDERIIQKYKNQLSQVEKFIRDKKVDCTSTLLKLKECNG